MQGRDGQERNHAIDNHEISGGDLISRRPRAPSINTRTLLLMCCGTSLALFHPSDSLLTDPKGKSALVYCFYTRRFRI